MNEQQVNQLIEALTAETVAKREQTAAINRLAESNEALVAMLCQSFGEDEEEGIPTNTYLSGKPKG
jgi:hypothetical protein